MNHDALDERAPSTRSMARRFAGAVAATWFAALAICLGLGGCFRHAPPNWLHTRDQCESYLSLDERAPCLACVQRPPPTEGAWAYFPNREDGRRCEPGNFEFY